MAIILYKFVTVIYNILCNGHFPTDVSYRSGVGPNGHVTAVFILKWVILIINGTKPPTHQGDK